MRDETNVEYQISAGKAGWRTGSLPRSTGFRFASVLPRGATHLYGVHGFWSLVPELWTFDAMTTRKKRVLVVLALWFLMWLPFSMTVQTLRPVGKAMHELFIYKGVATDLAILCSSGEGTLSLWMKARCLIDLPVSAVADTLCLPYTIYRTAAEPRKVAVLFIRKEDGGPGINFQSDVRQEERHLASLAEVCSVLNTISGQPRSVEVVVVANNSVPVEDFGAIYETVTSNKTLRWFYQPNAIEKNLLEAYLADKAWNKTVQRTGASRSDQETNRMSGAAGSRH